ncbi:hypothetical protein AX16_003965 [Volvariella volvacea WC 439]|nr:hypothetical protein AX16_003965 [Volvariella volvacea WC 439]
MLSHRPHKIVFLLIQLFLTIWNPVAFYQSTIPPNIGRQKGTENDIVPYGLRETVIMSMARCYPVIQGLYATFSWAAAIQIVLHLSRREENGGIIAPNMLCLSPTFFFGSALVSAGWFIHQQCYKTMREHFTFHITQLKKHKLITFGPYSIVRHPSYLGMLMLAIGTITTLHSPGFWFRDAGAIGLPAVTILIQLWSVWFATLVFILQFRMPVEDELLKKKFGEE